MFSRHVNNVVRHSRRKPEEQLAPLTIIFYHPAVTPNLPMEP